MLTDKKRLRNEGCFLEKGAWACAHTHGMVQPWAKRKEPADPTSPQTKPRELLLRNLPSALGVARPAPRGLACKRIRGRAGGQITGILEEPGREMGMRKAYVHCGRKER